MTDTKLEHLETAIESAQAVLDRAQTVVTRLEAAHERVDRAAGVLRQVAVAVVIGSVLLAAVAVRRRTR